MKTRRILRTLAISGALLAMAGVNANASYLDCSSVTLLSQLTPSGTACVLGDKLFSNFSYYTQTGSQQPPQTSQPQAPQASDISVGWDVATHSITFNFGGLAYVGSYQSMTLGVFYEVDVMAPGWVVDSVDMTSVGGRIVGGSSAPHPPYPPFDWWATSEKLVYGGAPDYPVVEDLLASHAVVTGFPVTLQTINVPGTPGLALTSLFVDDQIKLSGGTFPLDGRNTAEVNSVTNKFNEIGTGIPEPATYFLVGSSLLGLGALVRRRKRA